MIVAASTECFPELSFDEVLPRLTDLQFTAFELTVHEKDGQLKPSEVHADLPRAIELCRATRRLTLAAISVEIEAEGDEYYAQFSSCCKMARGAKVVALTVPSSELGAPFNAEVERLKRSSTQSCPTCEANARMAEEYYNRGVKNEGGDG